MEEKKNSKVWLVIGALLLVLAFAGGAFLGIKYAEKKQGSGNGNEVTKPEEQKKDEETSKTNEKVDNDTGNKTEEPDNKPSINVNAVGSEMFNKISILDDGAAPYVSDKSLEYVLLSKDSLSYISLDNKVKMFLAYNNIAKEKISTVNPYCGKDICLAETVDYSEFEKSYKDLFGNDKSVNFEEFEINCNKCTLDNGTIKCNSYNCGNAWESRTEISLNSSSQVNNDVVINVTKQVLYHEEVLNDHTKQYELTFKQDSSDNWYWYSTKAVN